MFKGLLWLSVAIINLYLADFLKIPVQQDISTMTALYCGLLSLYYFYKASRAE